MRRSKRFATSCVGAARFGTNSSFISTGEATPSIGGQERLRSASVSMWQENSRVLRADRAGQVEAVKFEEFMAVEARDGATYSEVQVGDFHARAWQVEPMSAVALCRYKAGVVRRGRRRR